MSSFPDSLHILLNHRIYFIQEREAFTVNRAFTGRNFLHGLAGLNQRNLIEPRIVHDMAAGFLPKGTEVGLELAIPANMVIRIITVVGDRIDVPDCQCPGHSHGHGPWLFATDEKDDH